MINAVQPAASTAAVTPAEAVTPVRRVDAEPAAVVVSVSAAGSRAADDWAKTITGAVHTSADTNQDGTVSDQEQQTEAALLNLRKAMLQGGAQLDEARQAYEAIASLADVQR